MIPVSNIDDFDFDGVYIAAFNGQVVTKPMATVLPIWNGHIFVGLPVSQPEHSS